MQKTSPLFTEKQMRYIQRTMKVSRSEIIETLRLSRTSAKSIVQYLKQGKPKVHKSFLIGHLIHTPEDFSGRGVCG